MELESGIKVEEGLCREALGGRRYRCEKGLQAPRKGWTALVRASGNGGIMQRCGALKPKRDRLMASATEIEL